MTTFNNLSPHIETYFNTINQEECWRVVVVRDWVNRSNNLIVTNNPSHQTYHYITFAQAKKSYKGHVTSNVKHQHGANHVDRYVALQCYDGNVWITNKLSSLVNGVESVDVEFTHNAE